MAHPTDLFPGVRLPIIAAPLFIVSGIDLVVAQCQAGIVGAFPSLNARPKETLGAWIDTIRERLELFAAGHPDEAVPPFAVNLIVHPANERLDHDRAVCIERQVPLIITSLHPPASLVPAVHAYGGLVFHDVTTIRHARKALESGVDGLVLVCAGAGGHGGLLNPIAFLEELRLFYDGPVALAGAIGSGRAILAAQQLGADFAYMGTRFIATSEANASAAYKEMIVEANAADIVYTPQFSGVHGNYLLPSLRNAGVELESGQETAGYRPKTGGDARAWKDIWGAGQGVGSIRAISPVAGLVERLEIEYRDACRHMNERTRHWMSRSARRAPGGRFPSSPDAWHEDPR